jgi:ABC-type bacteriocin/lantibiotic exporter with double-glycine peptidase domain
MPALPPLYRQRKSDNCALACLRMLLAHHGRKVSEKVLEAKAAKQPGGVFIEELARLAHQHGLDAEVGVLSLAQLTERIAAGRFPIVYLNRVHLDRRFPVARQLALRRCVVHAVVPVKVSYQFVTFNDPLGGTRRRVSKRKFEAAMRDLSYWCVVCRPREI